MRDSCHGEALFPGVIDAATGKSIVSGRTITGFTTEGEYDMHLMETIRGWNEPLIDEWAEKLGGKCKSTFELSIVYEYLLTEVIVDERSAGVWDDFHVTDGRLVTGMNPQSAKSTAKAAIEAFEKL